MVLGAMLGVAGFVSIDHLTRTSYTPPAFEQSKPERFADLDRPAARTHRGPYRYCSDAQADGATPIYRGQPGYNSHLDGDDDGIACERW